MNDPLKGIAVALILVALVALAAAFGSSAKVKGAGRQIGGLRAQVEKLTQTSNALAQELKQTQEKLHEQEGVNKSLKETFAREQLKNQALTEQLQRLAQDQRAATKNAPIPVTIASSTTTNEESSYKATIPRKNFSGKNR